MKYSSVITLVVSAAVVTGCASVKTLQATGGSRSDGVVEMSYQYGMFEKPQPQWGKALRIAHERCQAWGYDNAEAFGGTTSQCQARNGYGNCTKWFVTATYQCTGGQY